MKLRKSRNRKPYNKAVLDMARAATPVTESVETQDDVTIAENLLVEEGLDVGMLEEIENIQDDPLEVIMADEVDPFDAVIEAEDIDNDDVEDEVDQDFAISNTIDLIHYLDGIPVDERGLAEELDS